MSHHQQTEAVVKRLARIEGHVRAVKEMVEGGRPCPEVLIQLAAVRSALDQAARVLLEDHLEHCLVQAVELGAAEEHLAELKAALKHFMS
jgi:DNA-binding FrmR family transcriptional regulator